MCMNLYSDYTVSRLKRLKIHAIVTRKNPIEMLIPYWYMHLVKKLVLVARFQKSEFPKFCPGHAGNWNIFGWVFPEIGSEIVTIVFKEELAHLDG